MTGAAEWLEPNGRGGFASGTADLVRTRRYHALLLPATVPPTGRMVLVNGLEAWLDTRDGPVALSSHRYRPGVIHPDGARRVVAFTHDPWPAWTYALPDGRRLTQEVFVAPGSGQASMRWSLVGRGGPAELHVRPLLSGRDYNALHHENPAFAFAPARQGPGVVIWQPYPGLPPIAVHGGTYRHDPTWYRGFLYMKEQARGLDCEEDLASPGILSFDLQAGDATLAFRADTDPARPVAELAVQERGRRGALPPLHRAALGHIAARGAGATVIAGYPWFTDWGRDTFIALRGILLATGRHGLARTVLLAWAGMVDRGMLPNRFPDDGGPAEYNSVDASLWFVVAVGELLAAGGTPDAEARTLRAAGTAILEGYAAGTRHGIRLDADGLIACGEPGVQLTWMDAKVGDWVVTPRTGKPVEVQALWINALAVAGGWDGGARWARMEAAARQAVLARFPNPATGGLHDVVDVDGVPGTVDSRVRPNQVFAVGGLPHTIVPPDTAAAIVGLMERRLLTPLGLRTLDPGDPGYRGRYEGGIWERDGAYHQGDGLALAARPVRGGVAPGARQRAGGPHGGPGAVPAAAPRPPGHRGAGQRVRDRGRGPAAPAARLPVPGLVGGGADPDRGHAGLMARGAQGPRRPFNAARISVGSARRVKSMFTQVRRTIPSWPTRKAAGTGSSQAGLPLRPARSMPRRRSSAA